MALALPLLKLLGGFAVLLFGGDFLVRGAISLARRLKISPAVISMTIVAAGTSAPELMASILAALKGSTDIAIGNVVGSNIFNLLAILGVVYIVKPKSKSSDNLINEWGICFLTVVLFYFAGLDQVIQRWEGFFLVTVLCLLLYRIIKKHRDDKEKTEAKAKNKIISTETLEDTEQLTKAWHDYFYMILGGAALLGGANIALDGGIDLGTWIGLSERIIGITIISVGTGLPELATSVMAALRGHSEFAIGNVIGSNIFNTLGVLGFTAIIKPLPGDASLFGFDFWWLFAASLALGVMIRIEKPLPVRFLSLSMLLAYGVYLGLLL